MIALAAPAVDPLEYQGLVRFIAARYRGHGLNLDDLVSAGQVGLMRAVERFDPGRGTQFSTYATYWIRQAIGRAVRESGYPIRVPIHVQEAMRARAAGQPIYRPCAGIDDQIAAAERVRSARVLRDDGPGEDGVTLADLAVDPDDAPATLERAEAAGLSVARVAALLSSLPDRSAEVLRRRFGLDGREPETLQEVGDQFGITKERVRQIEVKAIKDLRKIAPRTERHIAMGSRLNGHLALETTEAEAAPNGRCPKCDRPYGKYKRCWACKPCTPRAEAEPRAVRPPAAIPVAPAPTPAAPAPPAVPATPQSSRPAILRELDAMRTIAEALEGLDDDASRRVLAWVGWHYGQPAGRSHDRRRGDRRGCSLF